MTLEGEEDLDVKLGNVVPCDSGEGRYGHIICLVIWDGRPSGSFGCAHFGGSGSWDLVRRDEGRVGNGEAKVSDTDSLSVRIASGGQDGYLANTAAADKKDCWESSESGGWMIDRLQRIGRGGYNGIK